MVVTINPAIAQVQLKLRKLKRKKQNKKLDIQQLKLNEEIRMKYAVEVNNQLQALAQMEDLDNNSGLFWLRTTWQPRAE